MCVCEFFFYSLQKPRSSLPSRRQSASALIDTLYVRCLLRLSALRQSTQHRVVPTETDKSWLHKCTSQHIYIEDALSSSNWCCILYARSHDMARRSLTRFWLFINDDRLVLTIIIVLVGFFNLVYIDASHTIYIY